MSEHISPRSSGKAQAVIFFLVFVAAGWLFLHYFLGDNPGEEALEVREEMYGQQAKAEEANAPSLAATTYHNALEVAQQGEQEYEEGKYTAAKLSFETAAEYFGSAAREAAENRDAPPKEDEENRPKQLALAAGIETRKLKNQAVNARAQTLARDIFESALEEEQQAEEAFGAGDYLQAESGYKNAGGLFIKSRDKAQAEALEGETDLSAIRRKVESQREEMLMEKAAAEQSGGETLAAQLFSIARQRELEGDKYLQAGTKSGYLNAQRAYAEAGDSYRGAGEAAKAKAREAEMEKRRAAVAAGEAEAMRKLREESDNARAAMVEVKRLAVGSSSEKAANAAFQKATSKEAEGERSYRAGEFLHATESFLEAKTLYIQASEEIAIKFQEKSAREAEDEKKRIAERAILDLVKQFEQSLENGELGQLMSLKENENGWKEFFRTVRDVSVNINTKSKRISLESGTAQVSFQVSMSYFNKTYKKTEQKAFSREWELQFNNGDWEVVFSRFY